MPTVTGTAALSASSREEDGNTANAPALASSTRLLRVGTTTYSLRGLSDEDEEAEEVGRWAAFCASVFSYKSNPPPSSYFQRHYNNDPHRRASYVRVATTVCDYSDNKNDDTETHGETTEIIAASCRIFVRTVSDGRGGGILRAGGIGEVCTSAQHRRRGLARELLDDAINIMREEAGFQVSFLHAAPAFFKVYESAGYSCTTTGWTSVPVSQSKLDADAATAAAAAAESTLQIRRAAFPRDTPRLLVLHRAYSESRFAGCVVRTEAYWNEYLARELEDTGLWVLERNDDVNDNQIVAWLSIRPRGSENRILQVREFGLDRERTREGYGMLALLLKEAIGALSPNSVDEVFQLLVPTVVLAEIRTSYDETIKGGGGGSSSNSTNNDTKSSSYLDWDASAAEDDREWMYKVLQHSPQRQQPQLSGAVSIEESNGRPPSFLSWLGIYDDDDDDGSGPSPSQHRPPLHLIWPSDSF